MKTNYLKYFPKALLDDIVSDRCVPIIGAGFSLNADYPPNKRPLTWNDLGKKVSEELVIFDYKYNDPIDALSYYEEEFSRAKLIETIAEELHINHIKAGKVHKIFASLSFSQVCTTNFDFSFGRSLR